MNKLYSARIIENGKARYADCCGYTPGDALIYLVNVHNVRKGATVSLGSAGWEGDKYVATTVTYQHMPEKDEGYFSAWAIDGSARIEYLRVCKL